MSTALFGHGSLRGTARRTSGVRRVQPRLEGLETRLAPACQTTIDSTGLLRVFCDTAPDRVVLDVDRSVDPPAVLVMHNGMSQRFPLPSVRHIEVNTDGGGDSVAVLETARPTEIRTAEGDDTIELERAVAETGAALSVTADGGPGSDTFTLSRQAQNLGNLRANLLVVGGTALGSRDIDTLNVHDRNAMSPGPVLFNYMLTQDALTRTGWGGNLRYRQITDATVDTSNAGASVEIDIVPLAPVNIPFALQVNAGNNRDTINVERLATAVTVAANGGDGSDTFNVSPRLQNLSNLRGTLTVEGGPPTSVASDLLRLYDQNGVSPGAPSLTYSLTSAAVMRSGPDVTVAYRNVLNLEVNTSNGPDVVRFGFTANVRRVVTVNAGSGADAFMMSQIGAVELALDGEAGTDTLDYSGLSSSTPAGIYAFLTYGIASGVDRLSGVENVTGTRLDDVLWGDAGANILVGNSGDDIVLGDAGDDLVYGNAGADFLLGDGFEAGILDGHDIMLGGDGIDYLEGGGGRDFQIGGLDTDILLGGMDDDIVISGSTDHDGNQAALRSILAIWTSNEPYQARVERIYSEVPGSFPLNERTVHSDQTFNLALGLGGMDFYFVNALDYHDAESGERVVTIQ